MTITPNETDGFFWTGSDDGSTINKLATQLPLDPQPWSWLSIRDSRYARALDWARTNLATTDTPLRINSELTGDYSVTGVTFSSDGLMADVNQPIDPFHGKPDDGAVWFEGTSQMALALDQNRRGDGEDAHRLLAAVASAQGRLGADQTFGGKQIQGGIVAASSPLNTGFGFGSTRTCTPVPHPGSCSPRWTRTHTASEQAGLHRRERLGLEPAVARLHPVGHTGGEDHVPYLGSRVGDQDRE